MKHEDILREVAQELNLPFEVVKESYLKSWEFIKTTIEVLPLKEELSEEEFKKLRVSFNLPSLGKFYTDYQKMTGVKEQFLYSLKLKKRI